MTSRAVGAERAAGGERVRGSDDVGWIGEEGKMLGAGGRREREHTRGRAAPASLTRICRPQQLADATLDRPLLDFSRPAEPCLLPPTITHCSHTALLPIAGACSSLSLSLSLSLFLFSTPRVYRNSPASSPPTWTVISRAHLFGPPLSPSFRPSSRSKGRL